MASQGTPPADPEVILLQILGAIAQGAATIRVGYSAAGAIRLRYLPLIQANVGRWEEDRLLVLEWARALGRQSAAMAVGRAAYEMEGEDVETASERLLLVRGPDGRCPFCRGDSE
jgi:hypothetical protein